MLSRLFVVFATILALTLGGVSGPSAWAQSAEETESAEGADGDAGALEDEFAEDELSSEEAYRAWANEFLSSLTYHRGEVQLGDGVATLQVPDDFYYLSADDAARVLYEAWGNPPDSSTLGMLFPAHVTPLDANAWGVDIKYEESGYVSDEDAADMDFAALLGTMQEDTLAANKERVEAGYDEIELIGWAAEPYYDAAAKKLHWAKELRFGDAQPNTLNYNIRVLGRKGVLLLNFIAGMDQLPEIEQNVPAVLAMADFNDGYRYAQFDPDIDTVAVGGIAALIAGKALVKSGILVAVLALLKKFGVIIVVAVGAFVAKLFRRGKTAEEAVPQD